MAEVNADTAKHACVKITHGFYNLSINLTPGPWPQFSFLGTQHGHHSLEDFTLRGLGLLKNSIEHSPHTGWIQLGSSRSMLCPQPLKLRMLNVCVGCMFCRYVLEYVLSIYVECMCSVHVLKVCFGMCSQRVC